MVYVDASALVKLLVAERESEAVRTFLAARGERVTSRVAFVEVSRAILRRPTLRDAQLATLWSTFAFRELDAEVVGLAATLEPASVRSLDAIHLASALLLARDLDAFVTYDARMAAAARRHGLPVEAPA